MATDITTARTDAMSGVDPAPASGAGTATAVHDDVHVELRVDPLRIVLIDDHALVREGLRSVLSTFDDLDVVAEADNTEAAIKAVKTQRPDVVLLDLQLHDEDGADVVRALSVDNVDVAVLVLSVHQDAQRLRSVLRAGARGYLLKSARPAELAQGIRAVAAGRWMLGDELLEVLIDAFIGSAPVGVPAVTPREREVLDLLAEGLANRAVADRLAISTRTAQKHVENLFKKFNVHERAQLLHVAGRSGLLQ